jgi:hypothetical protein
LATLASPSTPRTLTGLLFAFLASYAHQADDDTLQKMAVRIQARAIRRCGELLNQIEASKGGRPTQAAREAGLSEWQQKTAVRVANVPEQQFESACL